jgi:hypothetical protein
MQNALRPVNAVVRSNSGKSHRSQSSEAAHALDTMQNFNGQGTFGVK